MQKQRWMKREREVDRVSEKRRREREGERDMRNRMREIRREEGGERELCVCVYRLCTCVNVYAYVRVLYA